jgi:hypothetical protein
MAYGKALKVLVGVFVALTAVSGLQASTLWSNGAVNTSLTGDNRCDGGPNLCGNTGSTFWTVFDNFNVPAASKPWVVSGFDFSDFLTNGPVGDYKSTAWSIWNGDPLSGGKLVASGSATALLSLASGTCGTGSTCLETFTVTLGVPIELLPGTTYYLGTTNTLSPTNANEATLRAFAAGGNTAPGGTVNTTTRWEQSDGSTSGVVGSSWTAGANNYTFPGALGISETATAFDIQGSLAPEPGTLTLLGIAFASFAFVQRQRRQRKV